MRQSFAFVRTPQQSTSYRSRHDRTPKSRQSGSAIFQVFASVLAARRVLHNGESPASPSIYARHRARPSQMCLHWCGSPTNNFPSNLSGLGVSSWSLLGGYDAILEKNLNPLKFLSSEPE